MQFDPIPSSHQPEPLPLAGDAFLIRSVFDGDGGPLQVYANSMVIRAKEPVIVDTGTAVNRTHWFADICSIVDPSDVRWIFLSHDDHDHVGNLVELLELAPQATVVTTWFMQHRLEGDLSIPLDRVRWINDGDTFDVGDRTLVALRPPLYDSPTTRGLWDPVSGVYWAADSFALPMVDVVDDACELDPNFRAETVPFANFTNSPWVSLAAMDSFGREVDRIADLQPAVVASGHAPIYTGAGVSEVLEMTRALAGAPAIPLPGQVELQATLDALSAGVLVEA